MATRVKPIPDGVAVKNQFWGDRTGRILDPSGHVWTISTRVEETSSQEREKRWSTINTK
jgi:PhnB protein